MPEVIARQSAGELAFTHDTNYESRGLSVEKLIRQSRDRFAIAKDFTLRVWTDDRPNGRYSFSTTDKSYNETFPCYLYDAWPECGIPHYQRMIDAFIDTRPRFSKVGWIGSTLTGERQRFVDCYGNTAFSEALTNEWNRSDPRNLWRNTRTYMTFQQQIDRWKYLIDMCGVGWSGRAKILLSSPRIVFLVERIYEEWWYEFLEPWKHFVPVRKDFSDLEQNFHRIEGDDDLQARIRQAQRAFAAKYLTQDAALCRIGRIIDSLPTVTFGN